MPKQKRRGTAVFVCLPALLLCFATRPAAQERAVDAAPAAKSQAFVIPFSHLDRFWGGTGEECLARGNRIIAKAIRLAKQYPEFRFLIESDNFLANFAETHSGTAEMEDLKRLVLEGRIEIAPNWANIFHNLPDGEVHARNFLYGKRYARDMFGVNPRVFHPADIPGFTPQFPQLLRKTDTPYMLMTRMGPLDEALFTWKGLDDSRELVWNAFRGGYAWGAGDEMRLHQDLTENGIDHIRREVETVRAVARGPVYVPWGLDLWAPSEKVIENVHKLNQDLSAFVQFTLATPQEFFNLTAKTTNLPDATGEIPLGWPHVVDSILHLWQMAGPATNTLENAEEFATINYALGYSQYPQAEFEVLWKRLIDSMDHNHDGQGGEIGDNRKKEYSDLVLIRGGEILRGMQRNIAERVQIPIPKSFPIVVFNGLGWQRDDLVHAHVTLYGDVAPNDIADYRKGLRLMDATGKSIPFFVQETSENISRAVQLSFVAREVPAMGYKTYFLVAAQQPETFAVTTKVSLDRERDLQDPRRSLGQDGVENQFYRLTVDKATGGVTVFDKELNREVVKDAQIVGMEERGSSNVQPERDTARVIPSSVNGTVVEENNAVRTVLKITGWIADIPVIQRVILYPDVKRVDIENNIEWEEQRLVRIEQLFPVPWSSAEMHYGIPFGANSVKNIMPGAGPHFNDEIDKGTWEKYRTIQGWVFAGTSEWGVTVAADHQLVKLEDGAIHGNMIRGQRYTSVRIVRGDEVTSIHFPVPGHYRFRYSLSSGQGDWKVLRSYQAGLSFNSPLVPVSVVDEISPKSLPPTYSFCAVEGANLVISALKKSEADDSVILRLYEIQGSKTETPVTFLGRSRAFRETDILEQELGPQEERVLRVSPYEIKTLKLHTNVAGRQMAPQ